MKTIKLTRGYSAIVDDNDYKWLTEYKWFAVGKTGAKRMYAASHMNKPGLTYMHRAIMQREDNINGLDIDHINHNTLDNRRCNLRICTRSENLQNARARQNNHSKYKGVCFMKSSKRKKRWIAYIEIEKGKRKYLGYFMTEDEAVEMYNEAALEYFGEFAHLNEIKGEGNE